MIMPKFLLGGTFNPTLQKPPLLLLLLPHSLARSHPNLRRPQGVFFLLVFFFFGGAAVVVDEEEAASALAVVVGGLSR